MFTENRAETSELEKLIFLICFIFLKKCQNQQSGWIVCALFRYLSAVKNSAQSEHRAKSYACFMEDTSSYGFRKAQLGRKGGSS